MWVYQESTLDLFRKWHKNATSVADLWKHTGLLDHVNEDYYVLLGMVLENQKRSLPAKDSILFDRTFANVAVPLAYNVIAEMPMNQWVGIHPADAQAGSIWMKRDHKITQDSFVCTSRTLKTKWPSFELANAPDLNDEIKIIQRIGRELSDEFSREVWNDLRSVLPETKYIIKQADQRSSFYSAVKDADQTIASRCGHKSTWMLTSNKICRFLEMEAIDYYTPVEPNSSHGDVKFAGIMQGEHGGKIRVYSDPTFPFNEFLLGYRGSIFDGGYYYLPYIPLSLTGESMLVARYAKTMDAIGANYFRHCRLDGMDFPDEHPDHGTLLILRKIPAVSSRN